MSALGQCHTSLLYDVSAHFVVKQKKKKSVDYHLLGNRLGELVHAIGDQSAESTFAAVLGQEAFLHVLQERKRDPAPKGVVCHAHVGQSILADIVEEI